MPKRKVTKEQMVVICDRIAEGESLTSICDTSETLPSWRTILRYVQEDEEAYTQYRTARSLQCEVMRDQILEIIKKELPTIFSLKIRSVII